MKPVSLDGERIDRLGDRVGLRDCDVTFTRSDAGWDANAPLVDTEFPPEGIHSLDEAFAAINRVRDQITACEMHLNAIRSVFDTGEAGAVSREEIEPHLKPPTR